MFPCFVNGELTDLGIPVACETDVNGAVTAIALQAAAGGAEPAFFADLTIRHPDDDNAELLWHCGPFPRSLAHPDSCPRLSGHYMHPDRPPAVGNWLLKEGTVTLGRFDGDGGDYRFFVGHAESCDGPPTGGTYLWVKVGNWPLWEERLVCGLYVVAENVLDNLVALIHGLLDKGGAAECADNVETGHIRLVATGELRQGRRRLTREFDTAGLDKTPWCNRAQPRDDSVARYARFSLLCI